MARGRISRPPAAPAVASVGGGSWREPADTGAHGRWLCGAWRNEWDNYVARGHTMASQVILASDAYVHDAVVPLRRDVRSLTPAQLRARTDTFQASVAPFARWFRAVVEPEMVVLTDETDTVAHVTPLVREASGHWMANLLVMYDTLNEAQQRGELTMDEFEAYVAAAKVHIHSPEATSPDPDGWTWRETYVRAIHRARQAGPQALRGFIAEELTRTERPDIAAALENVDDTVIADFTDFVAAWNSVPDYIPEDAQDYLLAGNLALAWDSLRREDGTFELSDAFYGTFSEALSAVHAQRHDSYFFRAAQVELWRALAEQVGHLDEEGMAHALAQHNAFQTLRRLPQEDATAMMLAALRVQELDAPVEDDTSESPAVGKAYRMPIREHRGASAPGHD